jgi:putative FmdB family regulatory protein
MPIYEYLCADCGTRYEKLVRAKGQVITCPKCSSERHTLQLSVFRTASKSSAKSNGSDFSSDGCGCTPSTCGCH